MRVLMVSSEWPSQQQPASGTFIHQQATSLRRLGVDVEVFAFRGHKNPLAHFRAWRNLRANGGFRPFDVLHVQFGQSGLVSRPATIPMVVTFWGSDLHGIVGANGRYTLSGRVLKIVSRSLARAATEVIVVSEHLSALLPDGISAHVIPGGVDFERFRPLPKADARRTLGLANDKRLALFPFDPRNPVKRYHLARAAIEKVAERREVELLAVHGVPPEQIPLYMNASDVLVLTSKHEGSPTVVKEALACNLPVVSVDVGDVRQRLGRVEGCVVCRDDSPTTIAAAVEHVLDNSREFRGREAAADLEESRIAERIVAIYRRAIATYALAI